jgi:hypothetical protein
MGEIERALMSAVDFSASDEEVLHVARYMAHVGLDRRALSLFRNLSAANPYRAEPYVNGLEAAQRLKDEEGVQWACCGILSRAWPKEHQAVEERARRVAEAMLKDMDKEQRTEEASAFVARLNESLVRDCIVRVTWTGMADVDLLVEEPSATVCSDRNRYTTSGGVMLGDTSPRPGEQPLEGYSETYVCTNGFSGQYRLMLRRIWGDVTAGRVTVEICTNYGTPEQHYGKMQIPLGEKDAIVNLDLADGRRREPVAEQKLANLQRARAELGREILAQQFQLAQDRSASAGYFFPTGVRSSYSRALNALFGRPGAVGVRPVIQQFPEGNQLMAMAIISADRRYVRFSMIGQMPISSGITRVDTFNFVTGEGDTQGGGGNFGGLGGGAGGGFGGGGFF